MSGKKKNETAIAPKRLAWMERGDLPDVVAEVAEELFQASESAELRKIAGEIRKRRGFELNSAPLEESGAALVAAQPRRYIQPARREIPNPSLYTQIDANEVAGFFAPKGAFSRLMPGYESRPEQMNMARAVADSLNGCRHLVVEAGTGVGKTMAYLVPAILWTLANKVPVVISTNTKNLQSQIVDKDLPAVRRILPEGFKVAVIKGRSNYLCLSRLEKLLEQRERFIGEPDAAEMIAEVCAWIFTTKYGDLSELPFAPLVADKIASAPEECRGRKCARFNSCFLQSARARSLAADIVITNHSLYFTEPDDDAVAIPPHAQVIFDEAHNLEEGATQYLTRESSLFAMNSVLRKLHDKTRRGESGILPQLKAALVKDNPTAPAEDRYKAFDLVSSAETYVDAARESGRAFHRHLADIPPPNTKEFRFRNEFIGGNAWAEIIEPLHEYQDALKALNDALSQLLIFAKSEDSPDGGVTDNSTGLISEDLLATLTRLSQSAWQLGDDLEFTSAAASDDYVYWIKVSQLEKGFGASLNAAPIEVAQYLADSIFEKKESVICCSATMSISGKFDFIGGRIGIKLVDPDRISQFIAGSPFDYPRQCKTIVPTFLPDLSAGSRAAAQNKSDPDTEYALALAGFCAALAAVSRGRMMMLFTSYKMMTLCAEAMSESLERDGIRLLTQGAGMTRERITEEFKTEGTASVLMGADSFWEGVDLIGDALSCLVIARLPFDSLGDPIAGARSERVAQNGGNSFSDYSVPTAVIKFKQGFGRLIRHKKDRGIVVIADQRIISKNYGTTFARNIPSPIIKCEDAAKVLLAAERFLGEENL